MNPDHPVSAESPAPDAGGYSGSSGAPALPGGPEPGRIRRLLRAMRRRPLVSILALLGVLVGVELATIPWFNIGELRATNPAETALMRQRKEEAEDRNHRFVIVQQWMPITRLPRHLLQAVVVAEDGTFYTHGGIDWFEVWESVERNISEHRAARGASTITQQLAKNLYLSTSRNPVRKLKEVVITLLLEGYLKKERILELYLNLIEWGPGIFGVEAAAREYFGKPASALTLEESLRLAAVIPSPLRYRPDADTRYVLRRKEIVRHRLQERGWVPGSAAAAPPADPEEETGSEPSPSRARPDTVPAHPSEGAADTTGGD